MRFVGVDLAWGPRKPSGVCVVSDGRVLDTALLHRDDELLAWLEPHAGGPCVVAFDAPLVITNATGARPCERRMNRCFARFQAGCHPTNLGLVTPRAAGLAAALDLSTDPWFAPRRRVRRAVEVYPHAALVVLAGLERTLKYKARHGRTIPSRHAEFARLADIVEALRRADPPLDVATAARWADLRSIVTTATIGAALDRASDEIDAIVCAYVALLLWTHGRARTRVVGDAATGAIVTPVTPDLAACLDAVQD